MVTPSIQSTEYLSLTFYLTDPGLGVFRALRFPDSTGESGEGSLGQRPGPRVLGVLCAAQEEGPTSGVRMMLVVCARESCGFRAAQWCLLRTLTPAQGLSIDQVFREPPSTFHVMGRPDPILFHANRTYAHLGFFFLGSRRPVGTEVGV